jgi:hypothetical protein
MWTKGEEPVSWPDEDWPFLNSVRTVLCLSQQDVIRASTPKIMDARVVLQHVWLKVKDFQG